MNARTRTRVRTHALAHTHNQRDPLTPRERAEAIKAGGAAFEAPASTGVVLADVTRHCQHAHCACVCVCMTVCACTKLCSNASVPCYVEMRVYHAM